MIGNVEGRRARRAVGGLPAALVALLALAGGISCGPDPVQTFVGDFTRAVCKRTFECCAPDDVKLQTMGTDEASCVAINGGKSAKAAGQLVGSGLVRFDAAAAQRCLADLQKDCSAIFGPKYGRVEVCDDVFRGAIPLGGPCDDDFVCASNDCEGQRCVVRQPSTCETLACSADQFCDPTAGCQPRRAAGQACTGYDCASDLTCLGSTCAAPLADGQACKLADDCAGTCTASLSQPPGTCRPVVCQGH